MNLAELQQLTYWVLAVGFLFICYLITKIVKIFRKHKIKNASYGYLIIALLPLFELIKMFIEQPDWYGKPWFYNPFLYFWLLLLIFFLLQFFRERKK